MLRPSFPLRALVLVLVTALLAAACAGDADSSTTVVDGVGTVEPGNDAVPVPSALIIDEDPHSSIAATLTFEAGDHPIERIDYLGPKPSTNLPPTAAIVYLDGIEETLLIDLDASGGPSVMHLGDAGELRFVIGASEVAFSYFAPDGSVSDGTAPLSVGGGVPQAMPGSGDFATGKRVRHFDASVDVHRAVFAHISVSSTEAPLPPDLSSPYLRLAGCHTNRGNVAFTCNRVPGQVIESDTFLRTYRLAMTHAATAVAQGVDPSIWPSAESCEAALGNDWWITEPTGVALGTTATGLGTTLLTWLAANPQAAAAGAAAGQGFLPGIALSAAVTIGFWAGKRAASEYLMGSETDCENIKRRVVALNMLGTTVEDMEFTIEVCLPPVDGWTFDHGCQDIGPYRPFSSALATIPGDASTLDRNKLPPVEFIASAASSTTTSTTTTIPATTPAAMTFPITYSGTGTLTRSHSFANGSCSQTGQMIEVTLREDGTATAALLQVYPGGGGFSHHADGSYTADCGQGPGQEFTLELTGIHEPPSTGGDDRGSVGLDRSDGQRILEGTYNADSMQLEYRLDVFYEQFADSVADPRTYWDFEFPSLEPTT